MRVVSDPLAEPEPIVEYRSHGATAVRLADGFGEAHAYLLQFGPGGEIGRHEAGFEQLFVVVTGEGWVSGADGVRGDVRRGDVVMFDRGEVHAKGSGTGMSVVMMQIRDLDAAAG
jgi:quercetin dioxygenase-like cupin family protein